MENYFLLFRVQAKPMRLHEYCTMQGWEMGVKKTSEQDGYCITMENEDANAIGTPYQLWIKESVFKKRTILQSAFSEAALFDVKDSSDALLIGKIKNAGAFFCIERGNDSGSLLREHINLMLDRARERFLFDEKKAARETIKEITYMIEDWLSEYLERYDEEELSEESAD